MTDTRSPQIKDLEYRRLEKANLIFQRFPFPKDLLNKKLMGTGWEYSWGEPEDGKMKMQVVLNRENVGIINIEFDHLSDKLIKASFNDLVLTLDEVKELNN